MINKHETLGKTTFAYGAQGWWGYYEQLDPAASQPVQEFLYFNATQYSRAFAKPWGITNTSCMHLRECH